MNKNKVSSTGFRVLEALKELTRHPVSTKQLLHMLEEKTDNIYRKEMINKYLNTYKLLGIDVVKMKDKYYLEHAIERIDFDEIDLSLILFLKKYVDSLRQETFKDTVFEAFQVLEKSFSNKTRDIIQSKGVKTYKPVKQISIKDNNVKKFEKYCIENQKIIMKYKPSNESEEEKFTIAPLNVVYKNGRAFLVGYCYETVSYKEFILENITESRQTPQMSLSNMSTSVIFKLTGRLSKSYMLKAGEKTIEWGDDYCIISSSMEDNDLLVRRLLRYFDSCEVLYPKVVRDKIFSIAKEMEKMYV